MDTSWTFQSLDQRDELLKGNNRLWASIGVPVRLQEGKLLADDASVKSQRVGKNEDRLNIFRVRLIREVIQWPIGWCGR